VILGRPVFCNSRIARRTSQYVALLACPARTMANSVKTEQLAGSTMWCRTVTIRGDWH
jgi:hypothetical protein